MQFYTSLFRHPLLASSPGSSPQPSHARARAMLVLAWDSPVCPPFRPFIVHKLKYREEDLLYSRARARALRAFLAHVYKNIRGLGSRAIVVLAVVIRKL